MLFGLKRQGPVPLPLRRDERKPFREAPVGLRRAVVAAGLCALAAGAETRKALPASASEIPMTWDDAAMASLEIPLADPAASPKQVSADYYYRIPVRPIYKSYPVFAPGREPVGYRVWLERQEPETAFDAARLVSREDWIRAGELVFEAPIFYDAYARNRTTGSFILVDESTNETVGAGMLHAPPQ